MRAVLKIKTAFTLTDPENQRSLKGYTHTLHLTKNCVKDGTPRTLERIYTIHSVLTIPRFQSELRNLADFLFLIKPLETASARTSRKERYFGTETYTATGLRGDYPAQALRLTIRNQARTRLIPEIQYTLDGLLNRQCR